MDKKNILIIGITGMDGSYMADFLTERGYNVYGLMRRSSNDNFWRLHECKDKVKFIYGDLSDSGSIDRAIRESNPSYVINYGAMSFVGSSFIHPEQTLDINTLGVVRILEAIKRFNPKIKYLQASSSEQFGKVMEVPQTEKTVFNARSQYSVSKIAAFYLTVLYREMYGIFACNSICFNHEGPRRGSEFVTKKISTGVAKIFLGSDEPICLGNLDAKRDWGYAWDYVRAMFLMLQQEKPDDYVIATGETHSVREFVKESFRCVDMDITWEGEGVDEVGKVDGRIVVKISPEFYRPAEVDLLIGDATKAKEKLGWEPTMKFPELVKLMVTKDIERLRKE